MPTNRGTGPFDANGERTLRAAQGHRIGRPPAAREHRRRARCRPQVEADHGDPRSGHRGSFDHPPPARQVQSRVRASSWRRPAAPRAQRRRPCSARSPNWRSSSSPGSSPRAWHQARGDRRRAAHTEIESVAVSLDSPAEFAARGLLRLGSVRAEHRGPEASRSWPTTGCACRRSRWRCGVSSLSTRSRSRCTRGAKAAKPASTEMP